MTTRRKTSKLPGLIELGFDVPPARYAIDPEELFKLIGLGPLAQALYLVCLKPYTKGNGRVHTASWYRFGELLRVRRIGPGRRPASPSKDELRTALHTLCEADLATVPSEHNEQRGVLQIWLTHGVGGTASDSIRPGYRPGSRRPQSRASA